MTCRFESGVVIGVLFYGEAAQMVDGRRTVNPIHRKLSGFESLSPHKTSSRGCNERLQVYGLVMDEKLT